jgi:hypothetical protein
VSAATLRETRKGMIAAARNCGHWPTAATMAEYIAEVDRAIETWQREVARALAQQRNECVQLLTGPAEGSA